MTSLAHALLVLFFKQALCARKMVCTCRGCVTSLGNRQPQNSAIFLHHSEAKPWLWSNAAAGSAPYSLYKVAMVKAEWKRGLASGTHARDIGHRVRAKRKCCLDVEDKSYNGSGCIQSRSFQKKFLLLSKNVLFAFGMRCIASKQQQAIPYLLFWVKLSEFTTT